MREDRYLRRKGLPEKPPASAKDYLAGEKLALGMARRLGLSPLEFDRKFWLARRTKPGAVGVSE
jgi:thermostable 8-oxoguanine DNA glycosylase